MKKVVVWFTRDGAFDRATEAKARDQDLNKKTGAIGLKVAGSAEENKQVDLVRSRFLEVVSWMEQNKLTLNLDSLKIKHLQPKNHLEV